MSRSMDRVARRDVSCTGFGISASSAPPNGNRGTLRPPAARAQLLARQVKAALGDHAALDLVGAQ